MCHMVVLVHALSHLTSIVLVKKLEGWGVIETILWSPYLATMNCGWVTLSALSAYDTIVYIQDLHVIIIYVEHIHIYISSML